MKYLISILFNVVLVCCTCLSQNQDRNAVVAGAFYEDDPVLLKNNLDQLFNSAQADMTPGLLKALIVPHAGYPYSGKVAASGYNQLNPGRKYRHIFILASSHRSQYKGASIFHTGDYHTPLGRVKVDTGLAEKLIEEHACFTFNRQAHMQEHSIEVQLPFLQHQLGDSFSFIPILLGTHDIEACRDIAVALYPYFNQDNLFVVSADFSHYPGYKEACRIDKRTAESIATNSVEEFINTLNRNNEERIPNLATSLCAWPAVASLLFMTQEDPEINIRLIDYQNSGDSRIGDRSRVVGYHAISFEKSHRTTTSKAINSEGEEMPFELNKQDKKVLLELSRETLEGYVQSRQVPDIDGSHLSDALRAHAGAFVTLTKDGKLRGCIGRFDPGEPLFKVIQAMTISASTRDHRFSPVTPKELGDIQIEISVLSPMKRIHDLNEVELGKHGIYIRKGSASGTFLPQVAAKTGWTVEEFVCRCARDKAGIGWDGWKDAELYTYEAFIFEEDHKH